MTEPVDGRVYQCHECLGTGQTGMQRDGLPIECRKCRGTGSVRVRVREVAK